MHLSRRRSRKIKRTLIFSIIALIVFCLEVNVDDIVLIMKDVVENTGIIPEKQDNRLIQLLYNSKPWYGLCATAYAAVSVEQFRRQVEADPALLRHYREFDWENAYSFYAEEDMEMNVSYRTPRIIAWTKKKITIKKGEMLISDGKIVVRTYCCNQIAHWPRGVTLREEPTADQLQPPPETRRFKYLFDQVFIPMMAPPFDPKITTSEFPEFLELPQNLDIPFIPTPSSESKESDCDDFDKNDEEIPEECTCIVFPRGDPDRPKECDAPDPVCLTCPPPLNPVPEPSTFVLLGIGLVVLCGYRWGAKHTA